MRITNMHEAKTHLSRLVDRAAAGEEIIIGKAGKPFVRLVPFKAFSASKRKPGSMKGKIKMKPGFDKADQQIEEIFGAGRD
jgi:prevent-host-death family protein